MSLSCDNKNNQDIPCHLWKNMDGEIYIFCKINENFEKEINNIKIKEISFVYNKFLINIVSLLNTLYIKQFEKPLPFLYSKNQTINIEEGIDTYYLNFTIGCYQNEKLLILTGSASYFIFDKCSVEEKELICKFSKSELEEFSFNDFEFFVYYPYITEGTWKLPMVDKFDINYKLQKIDLIVNINRLVENNFDKNNFLAYEVQTNIEKITNLVTETFYLSFEGSYDETIGECFFKKTNENPLYLLCKVHLEKDDEISLSKTIEEKQLNDKHIKYNFNIQPIKNDEKITIKDESSPGIFVIQKTIDFYMSDTISIDLSFRESKYIDNIRINPDSNEDLKCENMYHTLKRCEVPKSHFQNKKSGYYYIYHRNHMNNYIKLYEFSPIQVIIPDESEIIIRIKDIDDKNPVKIGQKGTISFITDFIDSDNIFDSSNIETETINTMTFSSNNKKYQANCRLWKPKGEKLRLICNFNENIDTEKIILSKLTFVYKDYNITVLSENDLNINQLNSSISFLYSDKQIVDINSTTTEYSLVFKKEIYNKEPLILYNFDNNMKNIYLNCAEEEKEIKCMISKDKLVGILSKNGEKFYLSQLTESEGILKFENVLDIIINYEHVEKKNIILSIIKLLTQIVEKNNYIVFETNITDIQIITTNYFKIALNTNNEMNCLFKKNNNQKDDNLLLLCRADSSGVYQFDFSENSYNDLNILYSFKISKTQLTEKVVVTDQKGTIILSVHPIHLISHLKIN